MRYLKFTLLFFVLLSSSCSSNDDSDNQNQEDSLTEKWGLADLTPKDGLDADALAEITAIKNALSTLDCNVIILDIRADNKVLIEILEEVFENFECPDNSIPISANWDINGNTITVMTPDGFTDTISFRFENSQLILSNAEAFGLLGLFSEELIFEKLD